MSTADEKSVEAVLAQVQADVAAVNAQAEAAPGEAAGALEAAAASVAEIAGEMEPPAGRTEGGTEAVAAAEVAGVGAAVVEEQVATEMSGAGGSGLGGAGGKDVGRLLAIEVPVIVQLGMRRLTVGEVMRLAVGAIVEFGKSAEDELDLLVNNKAIGKGHAVKVGENFGIKVTTIGSVRETIKKLGS